MANYVIVWETEDGFRYLEKVTDSGGHWGQTTSLINAQMFPVRAAADMFAKSLECDIFVPANPKVAEITVTVLS